MKISPNALSVNQLLSASSERYVIPSYQRRYSWHTQQLDELVADIDLLEDSESHLLGSIVCLTAAHSAGINELEVVDGQQRLTSLNIILECIRQKFEATGHISDSGKLARLLVAESIDGQSVTKIKLESVDETEYLDHINGQVIADPKNRNLARAFSQVRDWIDQQSLDRLKNFLYKLQHRAMVIRLDVNDAKDAFKLFETINNRGLQLSPTDIIKNFLLGNAARFSESSLEFARKKWAEIIEDLDATNSDTFFRYYLTTLTFTNLTLDKVVSTFKMQFMAKVEEAKLLPEMKYFSPPDSEDEDSLTSVNALPPSEDSSQELPSVASRITFKEFLRHIAESAKTFAQLVSARTENARIDRHLRNLRLIKSTQTYGFLTQLRVGGCKDDEFVNVLKLTEAFVLRRHICKERSNDTERLFAKICSPEYQGNLEKIKEEYRAASPTNEKFRYEFAQFDFTATVLDRARYCLEKIEASEQGSHEELVVLGGDSVHVEHVMPQKIRTKRARDQFGDWVVYLGDGAETLHQKYVSKIGNLTLFAGALNIAASNNPFDSKKREYQKSSIALTKHLTSMIEFKFPQIENRSVELAARAVELWPIPD